MSSQTSLSATPEMCAFCFDTLIDSLTNQKMDCHYSFGSERVSLFVTWNKWSNRHQEYVLRGCIGTFGKLPLHDAIKEYALTAALEDSRFDPIQYSEIPQLECSVTLLMAFEEARNVLDWTIGVHGIIIRFVHPITGRSCSATYLPSVASEQGWTQMETLQSLYRKAGYRGTIDKSLLNETRLERYKGSKCTLNYEEYRQLSTHSTS